MPFSVYFVCEEALFFWPLCAFQRLITGIFVNLVISVISPFLVHSSNPTFSGAGFIGRFVLLRRLLQSKLKLFVGFFCHEKWTFFFHSLEYANRQSSLSCERDTVLIGMFFVDEAENRPSKVAPLEIAEIAKRQGPTRCTLHGKALGVMYRIKCIARARESAERGTRQRFSRSSNKRWGLKFIRV